MSSWWVSNKLGIGIVKEYNEQFEPYAGPTNQGGWFWVSQWNFLEWIKWFNQGWTETTYLLIDSTGIKEKEQARAKKFIGIAWESCLWPEPKLFTFSEGKFRSRLTSPYSNIIFSPVLITSLLFSSSAFLLVIFYIITDSFPKPVKPPLSPLTLVTAQLMKTLSSFFKHEGYLLILV
jgi:hypothetical protein